MMIPNRVAKSDSLPALLSACLCACLVVVFVQPQDAFRRWEMINIGRTPLLALFSLPLAIWLSFRSPRPGEREVDPVFTMPIFALIGLAAAHMIWSLPMTNGIKSDLIFLPLVNLLTACFFWRLLRCASLIHALPRCAFAAMLLLAASIILEMFVPYLFSELDRASGFPGNPNDAAFSMILLAAISLMGERRPGWTLAVLAIAGTAILATLSRGSGLSFILLALCVAIRLVGERGVDLRSILSSILAIGCLLSLVAALAYSTFLASDSLAISQLEERMQEFGGRTTSYSTAERIKVAGYFLTQIEERPISGHGTGFTRAHATGPHNIYIAQWVNGGIVGFVVCLAFFISAPLSLLAAGETLGAACMSLFIMQGFFSHNIFDYPHIWVTFAVFAAACPPVARRLRAADILGWITPRPRSMDQPCGGG